MEFGLDASAADVQSNLAGIVAISGGFQYSNRVKKCTKLRESVKIVAKRFHGKTCLFICDDLVACKTSRTGFLSELEHLLSTGKDSQLVISTRDERIASNAGNHVQFDALDELGDRSIQTFLEYCQCGNACVDDWS